MGHHYWQTDKQCKCFETLGVVAKRAVFASLRCAQSGCKNVCFNSGGASGVLSFEFVSFDLGFPDARYPQIVEAFDKDGFRNLRKVNFSGISKKEKKKEKVYLALQDVFRV